MPLAEPPKPLDPAQWAQLNTLSHIALPGSGPMAPGDRGVVFQPSESLLQDLCQRASLSKAQLAADFLNFLGQEKNAKVGAPPETVLNENDHRWLLVGVRAACDQAQRNGYVKPLVLGMEVGADVARNGRGLRVAQSDALMVTPAFLLSGKGRKVILNWHWIIALTDLDMREAPILYRLREPLINQIGAQMSAYIARPGIVSFG